MDFESRNLNREGGSSVGLIIAWNDIIVRKWQELYKLGHIFSCVISNT